MEFDVIICCILWIFLGLILIGMFWARSVEKKTWNNGICEITGEPWIRFDMDSQGGRGYKSIDGNSGETFYTWISYRGFKNGNNENKC
jgi:hypothetical protein